MDSKYPFCELKVTDRVFKYGPKGAILKTQPDTPRKLKGPLGPQPPSLCDRGCDPAQVSAGPVHSCQGAPGCKPVRDCVSPFRETEGMMAGPIIYLLGMNLVLLAVKIMCGLLGYNLGTSIIGTMTEQIEKVSRIASMIGVTVIAGLAVSFVKITTPIQYAVAVPGGEQKLITLQSMLDAIAPSMLPCAFVGLVFYLIKVKKWTTVKLVCMTIVLGILLSVLGIVA